MDPIPHYIHIYIYIYNALPEPRSVSDKIGPCSSVWRPRTWSSVRRGGCRATSQPLAIPSHGVMVQQQPVRIKEHARSREHVVRTYEHVRLGNQIQKSKTYENYKFYKIWFVQFIYITKKNGNFRKYHKFRIYFGIVGVFCIINRCFEYRIRILCIFLYTGTNFKDILRQLSTPKIEIVRPRNRIVYQKCETNSYRGLLFE